MKFLQTGDLHLGKLFYERSLIPDQKDMLAQIVREIKSAVSSGSPYQALLICGDVYDRSVPPAEAVELFSSFLAELRNASPDLHILIISGNHDSANRLSYAAEILDYQNIHIRTSLEKIQTPIIIEDTAFYMLPFCRSGSDDQPVEEKLIREIAASVPDDGRQNVLLAHLFANGAEKSDSERGVWGTAEQVSKTVFADFAYTALGHLHKCQNVTGNVWYSGSPLAYSFDESTNAKCLLQVELEPGKEPAVTKIPIVPLHKVVRLSGAFADFYEDDKYSEYKDDFVEISCTDTTIVENPVLLLRPRFANLLSFRQEKAVIEETSTDMAVRRNTIFQSKGNIQEHLKLFLSDLYQQEPPQEELEAFQTLLDEKEKDETA